MRDKVVIVTGASSGIGEETTLQLVRRGCKLLLVDTNFTKMHVSLHSFLEAGADSDHVEVIRADLARDSDLQRIVDAAMEKYERIDVLLNIAGVIRFGLLSDTTEEDYDAVMRVNTRAIFFLTQLALPHLVRSRGNVVNVSSVESVRPTLGTISYSMSKAALDHFTRLLAMELAPRGVRVNSVNPGYCVTPFLQGQDIQELGRRHHAMRRPGLPEEIAKAIIYLADDETGSCITGTNMMVDGGMYLMGPQMS